MAGDLGMDESVEVGAWPGVDVSSLVARLREFNDWRRGAEIEQPAPAQIGADIDAAADMLETMSAAIVATLENNLHLADGDNCALIDIARVARGAVTTDNGREQLAGFQK